MTGKAISCIQSPGILTQSVKKEYDKGQISQGVTAIANRIVEAYVGEYASGKSEVAVNRALELAGRGRQVTLVDLDIVEPCYTLRPIRNELQALSIEVIAWSTEETTGLGETGMPLKPEARWALRRPGNIVFDVGYGVGGSRTLNLIEGIGDESSLQILAVINASRPMTSTVADIVEEVRGMDRVHGLINNTHLGDETTAATVQNGARLVGAAAKELGIPVVATTAVEEIAAAIGPRDQLGNPVRAIKRFMPKSFW